MLWHNLMSTHLCHSLTQKVFLSIADIKRVNIKTLSHTTLSVYKTSYVINDIIPLNKTLYKKEKWIRDDKPHTHKYYSNLNSI